MQNLEIIADLFKKSNIKVWGVCDFKTIANDLIPCRAVNRLPQNPTNIISMLFPYAIPHVEHNISKYAFSNDYHITIMNILNQLSSGLSHEFPEFNFVAFCDNSPIPEVRTAALCNLGVIGSNGLLINKDYGSFVFIGEIVTDMPIVHNETAIKYCLKCNACINSCPGNALRNNKLDKNNCASFLSQKKSELTYEQKSIVLKSGLVWGCDTCQNCCPMNKNIKYTYIEDLKKDVNPIINLDNCEKLSNRAFNWRPINVIKRNIRLKEGD